MQSAEPRPLGSSASAWWALAAVQICFGSFPATGKLAMQAVSPAALCFWRVCGGAAVFLLLSGWRHGRRIVPPVRALPQILLLSLLGVTLNQLLFLEGLNQGTAVHSGVLVLLIPVFTLAWAGLRRKEPVSAKRICGVLLAVSGAAMLGDFSDLTKFSGDIWFVANAACYAVYLVEVRSLLRLHSSLLVITWMFVLAIPPLVLQVQGEALLPAMQPAQMTALIWVVLVPTVLAYLLNIFALRRLHASTAAVVVCVQPLLAAVLAVALLGEDLLWRDGVTFLCVAAGVWLATREERALPAEVGLRSQGGVPHSR